MMQKLTVSLPPEDWNIVFAGLSELPLKISANVFFAIKQQVEAADKEAATE